MIRRKKSAFTLVELMMVISIIGLLATIAVISLYNSYAKSRDGKRLADIGEISKGLQNFELDMGGYPNLFGGANLGPGGVDFGTLNTTALCTSQLRIVCGPAETTYMTIPPDPTGGGVFIYHYLTFTDSSATVSCLFDFLCPWYTLTFNLETNTNGFAGSPTGTPHTLTPNGIQ